MSDKDEYWQGYMDGRDPTAPEPGTNRDPRYVHSFEIGRAELNGNPIPAAISRKSAAMIEARLSVSIWASEGFGG